MDSKGFDRADPTDLAKPQEGSPQGAILAVHFGHSANCSSVGSVVDVLFMAGTASAALLAALLVGLRRPGQPPAEPGPPSPGDSRPATTPPTSSDTPTADD